jgi:hypothetical protein
MLRYLTIYIIIIFVFPGSTESRAFSPLEEKKTRQIFQNTPITLRGSVKDYTHSPVDDAYIILEDQIFSADVDGEFEISDLPRRNILIRVEATGFFPVIIPVHLYQPLEITSINLNPILLTKQDEHLIRFMFAGDTSFGRRFVNPESTSMIDDPDRTILPSDHPDALIQVSDPLPGAMKVVSYVRPLFETADYPVINLETPVLDNPVTPHPTKGYAFYTLPDVLPAFKSLGIEYVSLGNNHVYDYLDMGAIETIRNIQQADLNYSGFGMDLDESFLPYRTTIKGFNYSFLAMTSITGEHSPPLYVATETKAGAADLTDRDRVIKSIKREETEGYIPIAQLHMGYEYTQKPPDSVRKYIHGAIDAGARLVVSHHPHTAQGFEIYQDVFAIHSLGNFIFDQPRLETMLSLVAQVDMEGGEVKQAQAMPIYLEDYCPRLITGPLADIFIRSIAYVSLVKLYPYNSAARISLTDRDYRVIEQKVEIDVEIPDSGRTIVDLKKYSESDESIAYAFIDAPHVWGQLGRDIMIFGGFEETDIDEEDTDAEASRWYTTSDVYRSLSEPHRGAVAFYSTGGYQPDPDIVFYSVSKDDLRLADEYTLINKSEVAGALCTADIFTLMGFS